MCDELDEMLPNMSIVRFKCDRNEHHPCVYFKQHDNHDDRCKYDHHGFMECGSAVAQVNAMTIRLKLLGIEK